AGTRRRVQLPRRGRHVRRGRVPRVDTDRRARIGRGARSTRGGIRRDPRPLSMAYARSIEVLEAGIQTTVQDYPGRYGMRNRGFFPAGPMDHLAFRAANLLVGNPRSAAGLEITLGGLALRLHGGATVA